MEKITKKPITVETVSDNDQIEMLKKQVDMLMKVVDKNKLRALSPQSQSGTVAFVSTLDGKLVTSWKTVKDYVKATKRDGVIEDQQVEFTLVDNDGKEEKVLMTYEDSVRAFTPYEIFIKEKSIDSLGNVFVTFNYEGKEHKLNIVFINR